MAKPDECYRVLILLDRKSIHIRSMTIRVARMRFHDVCEKRKWLAEELTKELREAFQLPSVHVAVTVASDESGNADFSVMLCDLGNPDQALPPAVIAHTRNAIQEWFENSQPNVRAITVPAHYLPEAFVE